MEEWRDVEGYEGVYRVSNYGRIKSLGNNYTKREKILKVQTTHSDYLRVPLSKNHKQRKYRINRLVAIAFVPNPLNLPETNHKDENKHNNYADNLEWCTRKYNMNYGACAKQYILNLHMLNLSKRTKSVIATDIISGTVFVFASASEADRAGFGNQSTISACCLGKRRTCKGYTWKYDR